MTVVQFGRIKNRDKIYAASLLIAVTVMFGAGNVAHKSVLSELDTWSSLTLRATLAVMVLLPLAISEWRALGVNRRALLGLLTNPCAGFLAAIVFQSVGAIYTTATNLSFLINLSAIFTPLLCFVLGQCRFSIVLVVACLLSLGGTVLMSNGATGALGIGEWCCIGAALSYSWWMYHVPLATSRYTCSALLTCLQWVLPAAFGAVMTEQSVADVADISLQATLEIVFLGLGVSGLAYVGAARAQAKLSPVTAALIYPAEAVFGALIAMLWLSESLTALGLVGAVAILLAIVIVSLPFQLSQVQVLERERAG
jgi:drug/metabolite transporter (DMT)-like permease